jgi:hypothetical protein
MSLSNKKKKKKKKTRSSKRNAVREKGGTSESNTIERNWSI